MNDNNLMRHAAPILKSLTDQVITMVAAELAPPTPARSAQGNKLAAEATQNMFAEIYRVCVHEEGHAAAMRHLHPTCTPDIHLKIEAALTKDGVGIGMLGGAVSAGTVIDDPHECVVVSVAGLVGEIMVPAMVLEKLLPEESARAMPPNPFGKLTGTAMAAMVLMPSLVEAFPGCETDVDEIRSCVLRKFDLQKKSDMLAMEESEREVLGKAMAEFVRDACAAALRIVSGDAEGIATRAKNRALAVLAVVMEQSAIIAGASDRIRGAGLGLYTQEAVLADHEAAEAQEQGTTWNAEHTKGQA